MRLDKYLCELNTGTRSQAKAYIRQGLVRVGGVVVKSPEFQVNEATDQVSLKGVLLHYQQFTYFMLNKPKGVVSATKDRAERTVLDLLPKDRQKGLFPAGRLDKDTEGLLLLTDDGPLAHRLLSPKRHVEKTYLVKTKEPVTPQAVAVLEAGVDMGEGEISLPARVCILKDRELLLTIHEGKFHQVKRMLGAVDNQVEALKRVSFGGLKLDEGLKPGEYRELSTQEVSVLYEQAGNSLS